MTRFAFASASLLVAATACGGSSSTSDHQVTREEYDDVAQHVGSTTVTASGGGEVGSMTDAVKLSIGQMPAGLSLDIHGHINGNRLGLTYDYAVACSDAQGNKQLQCGDQTDRADVTIAWSGELVIPNLSTMIDRHGAWQLTGLTTGQAHLNGDGNFTFDSDVKSIFHPGESKYHLSYDATYEDVVIDKSNGPLSGSIHYTIAANHSETTGQSQSQASFDVDAELTFTGNGKATLVLDGDQKYTVDLSTGAVVHV
jgi:hypothetical protein